MMSAERQVPGDDVELLASIALHLSEVGCGLALTLPQEYAVQRSHGTLEPQATHGRHGAQHMIERRAGALWDVREDEDLAAKVVPRNQRLVGAHIFENALRRHDRHSPGACFHGAMAA